MMKVREKGYDFPVMMLSAKSEEVDKIMGLNMTSFRSYNQALYSFSSCFARVNSHCATL